MLSSIRSWDPVIAYHHSSHLMTRVKKCWVIKVADWCKKKWTAARILHLDLRRFFSQRVIKLFCKRGADTEEIKNDLNIFFFAFSFYWSKYNIPENVFLNLEKIAGRCEIWNTQVFSEDFKYEASLFWSCKIIQILNSSIRSVTARYNSSFVFKWF